MGHPTFVAGTGGRVIAPLTCHRRVGSSDDKGEGVLIPHPAKNERVWATHRPLAEVRFLRGDFDPHGPCGALDALHCGFNGNRIQVGHLLLGDLQDLFLGHRAHLVLVGGA